MTTRFPEERADELSGNTAVAIPYRVVFAKEVLEVAAIEKSVHGALSQQRINPQREFFKVELKHAIAVINVLTKDQVIPNNYSLVRSNYRNARAKDIERIRNRLAAENGRPTTSIGTKRTKKKSPSSGSKSKKTPIRKKHAAKKATVQPVLHRPVRCHRCGATMTVRNGKYGYFLGCTKYPICKNTMDLRQV